MFDYLQDIDAIDFRKRPDLYRIGRGEQGVPLIKPYKGELLPHWTFICGISASRFLDRHGSRTGQGRGSHASSI